MSSNAHGAAKDQARRAKQHAVRFKRDPRGKGQAQPSDFLVDKETDVGPRSRSSQGADEAGNLPAQDATLHRDLVGLCRREALERAEQLKTELQDRLRLAEDAFTSAMQLLYSIGLCIMAAPFSRRTALLTALGCKPNADKVFLSLINGFFPLPDAETAGPEAVKLAQNRHSTYGRAFEGARLSNVGAEDFGSYLKKCGGWDALAEVARAAKRPEPEEPVRTPHSAPNADDGWDDEVGDAASPSSPRRKVRSAGLLSEREGFSDRVSITGSPAEHVFAMSEQVGERLSRIKGKAICIIDAGLNPAAIVAVSRARPQPSELDREYLVRLLRRVHKAGKGAE